MKKSNKKSSGVRVSHGATATTSIDATARSRWPFVERRKANRRQHDRRLSRRSRIELPALDASHGCTIREQQVVLLLLQGLTNKEIAQQLGIAEDTVKKHLQHVYGKLGIRRRALLILEQVGRVNRRQPGHRQDTRYVR